uniref:Uncharacterized protein n=1 Tax=Ditylenchus dipsaci TaxID=166011 RepID=A0A915ELD5_9BILA
MDEEPLKYDLDNEPYTGPLESLQQTGWEMQDLPLKNWSEVYHTGVYSSLPKHAATKKEAVESYQLNTEVYTGPLQDLQYRDSECKDKPLAEWVEVYNTGFYTTLPKTSKKLEEFGYDLSTDSYTGPLHQLQYHGLQLDDMPLDRWVEAYHPGYYSTLSKVTNKDSETVVLEETAIQEEKPTALLHLKATSQAESREEQPESTSSSHLSKLLHPKKTLKTPPNTPEELVSDSSTGYFLDIEPYVGQLSSLKPHKPLEHTPINSFVEVYHKGVIENLPTAKQEITNKGFKVALWWKRNKQGELDEDVSQEEEVEEKKLKPFAMLHLKPVQKTIKSASPEKKSKVTSNEAKKKSKTVRTTASLEEDKENKPSASLYLKMADSKPVTTDTALYTGQLHSTKEMSEIEQMPIEAVMEVYRDKTRLKEDTRLRKATAILHLKQNKKRKVLVDLKSEQSLEKHPLEGLVQAYHTGVSPTKSDQVKKADADIGTPVNKQLEEIRREQQSVNRSFKRSTQPYIGELAELPEAEDHKTHPMVGLVQVYRTGVSPRILLKTVKEISTAETTTETKPNASLYLRQRKEKQSASRRLTVLN